MKVEYIQKHMLRLGSERKESSVINENKIYSMIEYFKLENPEIFYEELEKIKDEQVRRDLLVLI